MEMLQGKAAYDDIKAVMDVKDQIDVVILSYGMNDFLAQAPINNSDRPWTGFGTALNSGGTGNKGNLPPGTDFDYISQLCVLFSDPG